MHKLFLLLQYHIPEENWIWPEMIRKSCNVLNCLKILIFLLQIRRQQLSFFPLQGLSNLRKIGSTNHDHLPCLWEATWASWNEGFVIQGLFGLPDNILVRSTVLSPILLCGFRCYWYLFLLCNYEVQVYLLLLFFREKQLNICVSQ